MRVSLIVTTYNWPQALGLTLASVAHQSVMPDEVIVADDGSGAETAQTVQHWRTRLPCSLKHVWQEDAGFRLARSRNRALAVSEGEYIVLVDGDMILHRRFIEDHAACARPDCFIQGARPQLSPALTQDLLRTGQPDVNVFGRGIERRSYALRSPLLSRIASKIRPTLAGIQGCNQSYWRRHAVQVNGYDERFTGWGPEDREFAARLLHIGVMRNYVRHRAIAYHLYHRTRAPSGNNPFDRLLEETLRARATRAMLGLDAHLPKLEPPRTDAAVAMC
jgi:glycosyltransferase involved in cell wall biosynthesis